jgi:predicted nucleotidyltransferase
LTRLVKQKFDWFNQEMLQMNDFGNSIRKLREDKQLTLKTVAIELQIDIAILSKIERGQRKATREQVLKLAQYYQIEEKDLLILWLSNTLVNQISNEENGLKALKVAEAKVEYDAFLKIDRKKLLSQIKAEIKKFSKVQKAWIYGSFSREDDSPKSDIDIAIKTDEEFSYFDLAEIQYQLEKISNRKIDLGFVDSFKPYILDHVKKDLKVIYER